MMRVAAAAALIGMLFAGCSGGASRTVSAGGEPAAVASTVVDATAVPGPQATVTTVPVSTSAVSKAPPARAATPPSTSATSPAPTVTTAPTSTTSTTQPQATPTTAKGGVQVAPAHSTTTTTLGPPAVTVVLPGETSANRVIPNNPLVPAIVASINTAQIADSFAVNNMAEPSSLLGRPDGTVIDLGAFSDAAARRLWTQLFSAYGNKKVEVTLKASDSAGANELVDAVRTQLAAYSNYVTVTVA